MGRIFTVFENDAEQGNKTKKTEMETKIKKMNEK